jgi:hypothetical protein
MENADMEKAEAAEKSKTLGETIKKGLPEDSDQNLPLDELVKKIYQEKFVDPISLPKATTWNDIQEQAGDDPKKFADLVDQNYYPVKVSLRENIRKDRFGNSVGDNISAVISVCPFFDLTLPRDQFTAREFGKYRLAHNLSENVKFATIPNAPFRFVCGVGSNRKPFYGYELYIEKSTRQNRPFMGFFTADDCDYICLLIAKKKLKMKFFNIGDNVTPLGNDFEE